MHAVHASPVIFEAELYALSVENYVSRPSSTCGLISTGGSSYSVDLVVQAITNRSYIAQSRMLIVKWQDSTSFWSDPLGTRAVF